MMIRTKFNSERSPRRPAFWPSADRDTRPEFREIEPGHFVSCHFAETLELRGALTQHSANIPAAPDNRPAE